MQIKDIEIPPEGRVVHLKAYGFIKVFKIVAKDGDIEYRATDLLDLDEDKARKIRRGIPGRLKNIIEEIKQFCGIEKCQARKSQSQRSHIMFSLRAFLRLEVERLKRGISWFEYKRHIIRSASKRLFKISLLFIPHSRFNCVSPRYLKKIGSDRGAIFILPG